MNPAAAAAVAAARHQVRLNISYHMFLIFLILKWPTYTSTDKHYGNVETFFKKYLYKKSPLSNLINTMNRFFSLKLSDLWQG